MRHFTLYAATGLLLCGALPREERAGEIEHFETLYNSLTVERIGTVVELRARSSRGVALESAVDLAAPQRLVVPYTRTLYAGLFFQPRPDRVLMIGLGGAGFHRFFTEAFPDALLQSVELDPKVLELCESHLGFRRSERTPVAILDGRLFVKRDRSSWDWIILDAFRGSHVPAHLKTEEFYRECAARLGDRGVFISNLQSGSALYAADLRTIGAVFPQMVLFATKNRRNVIVCAVKYREPVVSDSATWPAAPGLLDPALAAWLDLDAIRAERIDPPAPGWADAPMLTDDFAPVEYLYTVRLDDPARR